MRRLIRQAALFTVIASFMVACAVPLALLWMTDAGLAPAPAAIAGFSFVVLGAALYAWCVAEFITRGRGTPAPYAAPEHLVTRGPYRVVRNPMYVAVTTLVFALALAFVSWPLGVYGLLLLGAFHLRVLRYEEPTLARLFDGEWDDYRCRVGRWLPFGIARVGARAR